MTAISLASSSRATSPPLFTYGDVIYHLDRFKSSLRLFDEGCRHMDGHNCTAVCMDPELLFRSKTVYPDPFDKKSTTANLEVPYNIFNCMAYPLVSFDIANKNPDPRMQQLANKFDIQPYTTEIIAKITNVQNDCFTIYCDIQTQKGEMDKIGNKDCSQLAKLDKVWQKPDVILPKWWTISTISSMTINPDIGGIGVSCAYVIQFLIIVTVWLLLLHLRFSNSSLASRIYKRWPVQRYHKLQHSHPRQRWLDCRRRSIILSITADFQKAQCFFLVPLYLAVLIALFGSPEVISSNTLGQFKRNMAYIQGVAQSGITFATATLFNLQISGHKEVYTWLLTCVAVSLGITTWALSFNVSKPELLDVQFATTQDLWVKYCGLVSPATYNGPTWDRLTRRDGIYATLPLIVFNWFVISALLVDVLWYKGMCNPKLMKAAEVYRICCPKWLKVIVFVLTETFLLFCLCFSVKDFCTFMGPHLGGTDTTLSLGQWMAIAIWFPTLIDAVHATVNGFERASSHRIAAPFEIVLRKGAHPEDI